MRAGSPISVYSSSSYPLFFQSAAATTTLRFARPCPYHNPNASHSQASVTASPNFNFSNFRLNTSSTGCGGGGGGDHDDYDNYYESYSLLDDEELDSISGDGVFIEIKKTGNNSRRIRSRISIGASLRTVWNILTDYERLPEFIPGLAVSRLIQKTDNCARLYQIGQQKLAFGLKFNAKGFIDCYEKDLESSPFGQKRDIDFKMIDGDFQIFEGKWSIEQLNTGSREDSDCSPGQEFHTTLSYLVDVKPKLWLPVRLVEGRLCKEIKMNLSCIREEAQKTVHNAPHAR